MKLPAMNNTPVSEQGAGVVASVLSTRQRFPASARVRAKAEFARVFDAGRRTAEPRLALHWLEDQASPRLGLAVSRKVDKRAVGRNRIKRALREAFRRQRHALRGGAYVVVARVAAAQTDVLALQTAFEHLLTRAGALPRPAMAGTMPPADTHLPASGAPASAAGPTESPAR